MPDSKIRLKLMRPLRPGFSPAIRADSTNHALKCRVLNVNLQSNLIVLPERPWNAWVKTVDGNILSVLFEGRIVKAKRRLS